MQRASRHEVTRRPRVWGKRAAIVGWAGALLMLPGFAIAQTPAETPQSKVTPAESASPVATPSPAEPGGGVSTANAELGEIEWAREIDPATNAPTRRATGFITTDVAIYAVAPVSRILEGTVVSASWSFNGVPIPALDTSVTADHSYENGFIAFQLSKPDGEIWPTGEYGISISVGDETVLTSSVMVRVPPA